MMIVTCKLCRYSIILFDLKIFEESFHHERFEIGFDMKSYECNDFKKFHMYSTFVHCVDDKI